MNAAPIPEDSDDQLESVAEELLGVDFTTPADFADPLDLDDDDLFGDELVDEPEFAAELPADAAASELPAVEATSEAKDDFGLDPEESAGAEAHLRRGPSAPRARDDSYWDALEGWDWDEGAGTTERTAEPPTAEVVQVPPSTPEFSSPAATRKTAEFREDDDFGAGLVDESTATPARPVPGSRGDRSSERKPLPERTPERQTEGRRTRSGERDEGRRPGRSGRRDAGSGGRGRRGRDEDRPRREPPPTPPRDSEPEPVVEEVVEEVVDFDTELSEFGAGLDVTPPPQEAAEPERGPRRGRRRRGRGRGRDRAAPAAQDVGAAPVESETRELDYGPEHEFEPVDDLSELRESDQPEEFGSAPAPIDEVPVEDAEPRYGDVPTWAEAISYLFNPKVRSSSRSDGEGTRGGETESRGGPRSSSGGERGRRGGSRRGGGRGRRSSGTND